MFDRIHQKLGTASFIISIVALVAALGGGAYAASGGLNGKQKKEVEKISKKFAGKPGPMGSAGPAGPAGKNGADGTKGVNGSNGASGTSATTEHFTGTGHGCTSGGVVVKSASPETAICNGQTGFTETLPAGKTETGTWVLQGEQFIPISFPIPIEPNSLSEEGCEEPEGSRVKPCQVHFVPVVNGTETAQVKGCEGGTSLEPAAEPGNFCLFQGEGAIAPTTAFTNPKQGGVKFGGPGLLFFGEATAGFVTGSWAVTAPTP